MNIGEKIKKARLDKGLSQRELAKKINVQPPQLSQWEKGIRNPKRETLIKIAHALEISPFIFTNVDYPNSDKLIEIDKMYEEWKKPITDRLTDLIVKKVNTLNDNGKRATLGYINDIADNPKYKK